MSTMQFMYLHDLKGLDDIQLGMLAPSSHVKRPNRVRQQCYDRGWIRIVTEGDTAECWGFTAYLTTKGLRAYQRQIKKFIADADGVFSESGKN